MDDNLIVELYWIRDEAAIRESESKYSRYLTKIAYNILADLEDSEESVNDTYLKAWNSMPPHKPGVLSTYLGKITRQTSIDIFRKRNSKKRHGSEYTLSLSELEECIPDEGGPEQELKLHELAKTISTYLRTLSPDACHVLYSKYVTITSIVF